MLAREAVAVHAALSTPTKQKEKKAGVHVF